MCAIIKKQNLTESSKFSVSIAKSNKQWYLDYAQQAVICFA